MNALTTVFLVVATTGAVLAEATKSVETVAEQSRESVVVITTEDREGNEGGLGSGFVVGADGLIATNLHVIGEARPIWVQGPGKQRRAVNEVVASDRALDLAIVRIDAQGLRPLALADQDVALKKGQHVVAIGHPLGLKNSVVSGVVSGEREFDGTPMWQVAMPIEPGNSGGPLMDMQGRVHGILAMKSMAAQSIGFAIKIDQLKKLLDHPNPIPIDRWKTIGQIDASRWTSRSGARWRQRSGKLLVEEAGSGFGGRALLLSNDEPPELPFELAVSVQLDDEAGAAGLVFHSDGADRHYGFYPSNGRLRLTSFEGPNVFSWHVVREVETDHYLPGDWNELKVRVEEDKIVAHVNGQQVVTVHELRQPVGRVGLCKFRQTKATFKRFRVGKQVESDVPSVETAAKLADELRSLPARAELLEADLPSSAADAPARIAVLQDQARQLARQADQLRALADDLHVAAVCEQLRLIASAKKDSDIDLLRGALWIARLDNPELEVDTYVAEVDRMVAAIRKSLAVDSSEQQRLAGLDTYLFEQHGFHGSRTDYYNAANSHLDRVVDDREGLPITLSVLYLALAARLDISMVGVGLPGHFVVRYEPREGESELIDVFDRGKRLTVEEAERTVLVTTGRRLREAHLAAASHRDILLRMLTNLLGVARRDDDRPAMLRYLEALVTIDSEEPSMRGMRAVLRHQHGRRRAAVEDLDWILENQPPGVDLDQVRRMRDAFSK